jgi:hypothetical protein
MFFNSSLWQPPIVVRDIGVGRVADSDSDAFVAASDLDDGGDDGGGGADHHASIDVDDGVRGVLGVERIASEDLDDLDATVANRRSSRYFDPMDQSAKCYCCGQVGHIASQCTNPPRAMPCHVCGRLGHNDSLCPNELCHRCLQPGHFATSCSNTQVNRTAPCLRCGDAQHKESVCPMEPDSTEFHALVKHLVCIVCGSKGHINCNTTAPVRKQPRVFCSNCAEKGHVASRCTAANFEHSLRLIHWRLSDCLYHAASAGKPSGGAGVRCLEIISSL